MTAFESQSTHTGQQTPPLMTQLTLLIDELLFQWCIYQLQTLLLLLITIAVAVSTAILFCNVGSTSSNPVPFTRVEGGRGFLTRHLRSTSQDDDLQTPPPQMTTSQLPPSGDSLIPPALELSLPSPATLAREDEEKIEGKRSSPRSSWVSFRW